MASIPAIVSKWVGQTERNLDNLFHDAKRQGAVPFLDEADALLMERGEGHASRHDDAAVNVLLALARRLTDKIHFPMPDAPLRVAIWARLLPDSVPVEEELDFERLGHLFELAGGDIKNAVFKAAFRAANANGSISQVLLEEAGREVADSYGKGSGGAKLGFGRLA